MLFSALVPEQWLHLPLLSRLTFCWKTGTGNAHFSTRAFFFSCVGPALFCNCFVPSPLPPLVPPVLYLIQASQCDWEFGFSRISHQIVSLFLLFSMHRCTYLQNSNFCLLGCCNSDVVGLLFQLLVVSDRLKTKGFHVECVVSGSWTFHLALKYR